MASPKCDYCGRVMKTADGCDPLPIETRSGIFERIPWGAAEERPCGDCGAKPGGYHHPGCLREVCPRCNGQLAACGCFGDD